MEITITKIDYDMFMNPIIYLDNGQKLKCKYQDGIGESAKSTARNQLETLIGHSYKNIYTLKWYICEKKRNSKNC